MSAGIRESLSKLSLKKGDIILCSNKWVMDRLLCMRPPEELNFNIPIIQCDNFDDIKVIGRDKLEEALKLLDQNNA